MKISRILSLAIVAAAIGTPCRAENLESAGLTAVEIDDAFWAPKLRQWSSTTANDVLDKFESHNNRNTLDNFRNVAKGDRDSHNHVNLPWFDGLIYESIRGIADLMVLYPDKDLKMRVDSIVGLIAAAQATEPTGYINTYTQLTENGHRWGENGGLLRWMHDVYNAGMLIEAGVHYYNATGETKLLGVATSMANLMCDYMGPEPKHNLVPAHSGPEEAMVKLYRLYSSHPELADKTGVPARAGDYLKLAEFWIDQRGHHCGLPNWGSWGNENAEQWIRDNKYADTALYGNHSRPTFGPYAQDSVPLARQKTIEGHAVRATLYLTGVAAAAKENGNSEYIESARRLWDNMTGRRMYITGGVGAVSFDEKFGNDYYLPSDAYLETCAAVGSGFFSNNMHRLTGDGRYMDEYERVLYNGVLTGISLDGDNYTYQNPLNSDSHARWEWHDCPCCPPMFLKFMGNMPENIYSHRGNEIYVNLYAGSRATLPVGAAQVALRQTTAYPFEGDVRLEVNPSEKTDMSIRLRIPGWARSSENPHGLYASAASAPAEIKVNGKKIETRLVDGYAVIDRKWKKGDVVTLSLPMQPRYVTAHPEVKHLAGQVAIACGPLVYCLESVDNDSLGPLSIDTTKPLQLAGTIAGLDNAPAVSGTAVTAEGSTVTFRAIPYYLLGNRKKGTPYRVWLPARL